jgi:site-specific DNA-methyltransferase (adenine-specific)
MKKETSTALFSSKKHDWETPRWVVDLCEIRLKGTFDLDAAASEKNSVAPLFLTKEQDALTKEWVEIVDAGHPTPTCKEPMIWCNPPYGRDIGKWVEKCYHEAQKGAVVCCLIPARTDTLYWHNWCFLATEWWFVKGRIRFKNTEETTKSAAPFPSVVVVFSGSTYRMSPKVRSVSGNKPKGLR